MADLIETADQFRQALLSKERASAVRLVNAYGDIYVRLQPQIEALTADLVNLEARGELATWKVQKLERLKSLKKQIEAEVTRYAAVVENEINQGAKDAIAAGQKDARALVQASLPGIQAIDVAIMATWQSLPTGAITTLLGFLSEGSPLREALRTQLGKDVADRVGEKLIEGIGLGYGPRKTAAQITKELGLGLDWSLRTSRTAQLYAYRESTRASYVTNGRIVKGWTWRSARDRRTCNLCIALDGTKHSNDERLNGHFSCRCVMVPLAVTYRELGLNVAEAPHKSDTGPDWFKTQPPSVQKEMLGKGKYELWQGGKLDFQDLVSTYDDKVYGTMRRESTLKELVLK